MSMLSHSHLIESKFCVNVLGVVLFSIHSKKGFVFIASDSGKGPMVGLELP